MTHQPWFYKLNYLSILAKKSLYENVQGITCVWFSTKLLLNVHLHKWCFRSLRLALCEGFFNLGNDSQLISKFKTI